MNFQQYFNIEYKKKLIANVARLKKDLVKNDLKTIEKIDNYADKWNLNHQQVFKDVSAGDEYALRQFAIDPARQNLSEKLQAKYNNLTTLPNTNKHKWTDGEAETKTIDGMKNGYFIFMKVIRQSGGQQDDVKKEAEEFIRIIQKDPKATGQKFIILIDDFTKPCLNRYKKFIKPNNKLIKVMNSDELKLRKDI